MIMLPFMLVGVDFYFRGGSNEAVATVGGERSRASSSTGVAGRRSPAVDGRS
jgi:hypothetical protein